MNDASATVPINEQTVLVTGAGGFIGNHCVRHLANVCKSVRALTGPGDASFDWPANVISDEFDVRSPTSDVEAHLTGVNTIIHLAGPPAVRDSFQNAQRYVDIHTGGTTNVIQAATNAAVQRFVYLSSAEVYGQPLTNPVPEEHRLLARSPYGAAKIGAERVIESFTQFTEIDAVILRPFSVYGPGQTMNSLLGTIIRKLQAGDRVELFDLRPIRDYLYVADLAKAIEKACTAATNGCTVLNVGSGSGTSVQRFAELTSEAMDKPATIEQASLSDRPTAANIYELVADCRKAERVLNWGPTTDLRTGLRCTVSTEINA